MKLIEAQLVHLTFIPKADFIYPGMHFTLKLFAESKHGDKYDETFDFEASIPVNSLYLRAFMALHDYERWLPLIKTIQKRIAANSASTVVRKIQHVCPILPGKTTDGRKQIIEHINLVEKAELLYQAERSAEYLGMKLVSTEA